MEKQSGYAPIHGLQMYYEIHGVANSAQPPLVLLHGGGDTIQTSFGHILPVLARDRQVVAFEQQGFGHTADIADRPFRFEQSADDTAALLKYLHIEQADIFGFSNGATIALHAAIRHPQVVRKLVMASGFFQQEGSSYPWFWEGFAGAKLEQMPTELREAYLESRRIRRTCRVFLTSASNACGIFRTSPPRQYAASPLRRWSSWATRM